MLFKIHGYAGMRMTLLQIVSVCVWGEYSKDQLKIIREAT